MKSDGPCDFPLLYRQSSHHRRSRLYRYPTGLACLPERATRPAVTGMGDAQSGQHPFTRCESAAKPSLKKPNLGVRGDAKLPIKVFSSHFALLPEPPEFHPVVTTIPGRSSSGSVFPSQPALRSICRCTCGIREFPSNTGDLFFFVSRCKHERFRRFHCGRW